MKDAREAVAKYHFSKRRMNMIGEFPGEALLVNDEGRLSRQECALNIVDAFREENERKLAKKGKHSEAKRRRDRREKEEEGARELLFEEGVLQRGELITIPLLLEYLTAKNITLPRVKKAKTKVVLLKFFTALHTHPNDVAAARAAVEAELPRSRPAGVERRGARRKRKRGKDNHGSEDIDESSDPSSGDDPSSSSSSSDDNREYAADSDEDEELWVVEDILKARKKDKGWEFWTVWVGSDEKTWEEEANFGEYWAPLCEQLKAKVSSSSSSSSSKSNTKRKRPATGWAEVSEDYKPRGKPLGYEPPVDSSEPRKTRSGKRRSGGGDV